jgi:hypothetical protein
VVFPDSTDHDVDEAGPMQVYVVERFLVGWSPEEVEALLHRTDDAAPSLATDGVHHLESIVIPEDETCLSVFVGPDAAAVREANRRSDLPLGRVLDATTYGAAS